MGKDYVRDLCIKIVQTDTNRRKDVARAKDIRKELQDTLKSQDMGQIGRSGETSDPTADLCAKLEVWDKYIKEQQERIEAVKQATENIGRQYDEKTREQMLNSILLNLSTGGYLPFHFLAYPWEQTHFYATRKQFLRDIAKKLNLVLPE